MRIIGGTARGRKLSAPGTRFKGQLVRPTSDRAREAIFNILGPLVQDSRVLDLFAGTGALGLEALSRGARSAVFVEQHPGVIALIRKNIEHCGFSDRSQVVKRDLAKGLFFLQQLAPSSGFDLVFLDPPYGKGLAGKILRDLADCRLVRMNGVVVAEESAAESLPEAVQRLHLFDRRHYGEAGFWFYRMNEVE